MKKVRHRKLTCLAAIILFGADLGLVMDPVHASLLKLWRYVLLELPNAYCRSAHAWERQTPYVLMQSTVHYTQAVFRQPSMSDFLVHSDLGSLFVLWIDKIVLE
ncbi:hypothetical protein FOMG_19398 [Fusarium oxysporum f. sp. melonis 26406]|jgi:hypothetical protein|uniref:Uncharacterized protein n=1 Tax=Fusarium oxysporum f. sp. melonis 26406 TaxID=1089452 RepID=W9Z6F3_FUSOX|nr:hypothetical protein FOMG_19398 [Fusarium oxysporum f. sp. melonis 26406]